MKQNELSSSAVITSGQMWKNHAQVTQSVLAECVSDILPRLAGSMKDWHGATRSRNMQISKWLGWRWFRGPPSFRACLCDAYKALAPSLIYIAALVVVVLYALTDHLHSFLCRLFMSQYHYPYAAPLALMQVVLNLLMLLALHLLGLVRLNPFSWRLAEKLLVPAVCGSVQAVLALWAEASAHSGLYPLAGQLLPLAGLTWTHLLAKSKPGFTHFTCFITAVTVMSVGISAYEGLHAVQPLEYIYSPLSVLLHSLSLTWLSKLGKSKQGHTSTFDLYYGLTVIRSVALVLLCALHPDTPRAFTHGSWHSLIFIGFISGTVLSGAAMHFLVDVTALSSSAPAAALLHSARGLALPIFNLL
ncbi:uncharacterized protein si:ch211-248a14.8 [Trichomycterus rosablanca]|uniref:uncharacterized protein si:ch211-248a14.8 n=1 Tax=Trichomycterus rosablanca TaxID=2290929 RepID=UPI002F358F78